MFRPDATSWDKFHVAISKEELYHENDPVVDALLNDMTHMEFLNISKTFSHFQLYFMSLTMVLIWI